MSDRPEQAANAPSPAPSGAPGVEDLLPKTYRPADHEERIRARWEASGAFHADPANVLSGAKKPYSIVIPPPNVTGALHLGHALNNTLQDVLIRAHRMMGYEAIWLAGADHAGIATQTVVEKRLLREEGKRRTEYQRDEFVARVQQWKDEYEATIKNQLQAMGCSCDWERWRFTMDEVCAKAVREAFFQLFKDGLIYRGKRLVNWDPATQTALADDEVEMEEIDGSFYYLRYPLVDKSGRALKVALPGGEVDHVTVATTRPETYLGDTAVAVNPADPRWEALKAAGAHVKLPFVERVIPIVADDYVVMAAADPDAPGIDPKAKYATGFLKVTPAHDPNDWDIGLRHKLEAINVMAPDASISDKHGWSDVGEAGRWLGLSREKARKEIVKAFKEKGLLEDQKNYRHSVGHSYRSHVPIEPYLSDQWYVKVTDDRLRGSAQRAVAAEQMSGPRRGTASRAHGSAATDSAMSENAGDGSMRFYPERYAKMYEAWHDNIRDWCISRQLWWGHRIPVWSFAPTLASETPGVPDIFSNSAEFSLDFCRALNRLANSYGLPDSYHVTADPREWRFCICTRSAESDSILADLSQRIGEKNAIVVKKLDAPPLNLTGCSSNEQLSATLQALRFVTKLEQDPDVLDTWFSSALWPLSTMGWPEPDAQADTKGLLDAFNPTSVLSTAREIITLWVSRMVMFNRYLMPDHRVPFHDVYIHLVVQDGDGKRMSKSAGNGVDPLDIIASHGADAMRFTLCQMATPTQDVRMPVAPDPETGRNTSPKFDLGKRFCNKLWNASRFTMMMLTEAAAENGSRASAADASARLSLVDQWMLSRLASSIQQIEGALKEYQFSVYAQSVYDLLWRDFCDWYLEAIKPTLKRDPMQQAVLRTTLDCILRLLHPLCPFVTEAIFEKLRELPGAGEIEGGPGSAAAQGMRGAPGTPRGQYLRGVMLSGGGGLLCLASWPAVSPDLRSEEAEQSFERMRELIETIRNVREKQQVSPRKRLTLHVDAALAREIDAAGVWALSLAGLERVTTDAPQGPSSVFRFDAREHRLSGLVEEADAAGAADSERERLAKQISDLDASILVIEKRLGNPGYAAKAPPALVKQSQDQLAALQAERAAAAASLERLG